MFNEYPYINLTDINLDWIIKQIKELQVNLEDFIRLNTVKYADPIDWNISTQYEANTVVVNDFTGVAYLSVKPVPAGVDVTNTEYWTPIFTLDFVNLNKNITLRNDGNNNNATFPSETGDWLIVGGQLYKVTQDIGVHTAYVVGYNIEIYSVELFVRDYVNALNTVIGSLSDLDSDDKTSIVNAINSVLNDTIGDLDNLTTNVKSSIVAAINSLMPAVKCFDTVADMTAADLSAGECVKSLGYYTVNDGGGACYVISDTAGACYEVCGELYANLIFDTFLNVKQLGLKGGFQANSSAVINRITTLLHDAEYSSNYYTGDFYYGNNLTLYFPRDNYKLNMTIDANQYTLEGNGSVFNGDGGVALTITGYHVNVNNISFVSCSNAILYNGQNLESGYFNVTNCRFYKTTSDAIQINGLQSYIGTVERCAFLLCEHTLKINQQADLFTMRNCWVSVKPMTVNYDASVILNATGELVVDGCLFVPTGYSGSGVICAYIKASGNCTIVNSHFGGELGSLPLLITDVASESLVSGIFTIKDCPQTYSQNNGRALVLIKSAFRRITIDNCMGFVDYQKPVRIVPGYTPDIVNYGDIVLTNLRGNTWPHFSTVHGLCYKQGAKYLEKELYPFLICDDHITMEGLNLTFNGGNITGYENTFVASAEYSHYGQIHALVEYRELDTSDASTYYYKVYKTVDIDCYLNNQLMTFKCSDPDHFTVTNNSDFYHDTDITLAPTSLAGDFRIIKVWADKWSNEDEYLVYPDMT